MAHGRAKAHEGGFRWFGPQNHKRSCGGPLGVKMDAGFPVWASKPGATPQGEECGSEDTRRVHKACVKTKKSVEKPGPSDGENIYLTILPLWGVYLVKSVRG
ncbi:unnamed protein product [Urochloa humidicola]